MESKPITTCFALSDASRARLINGNKQYGGPVLLITDGEITRVTSDAIAKFNE